MDFGRGRPPVATPLMSTNCQISVAEFRNDIFLKETTCSTLFNHLVRRYDVQYTFPNEFKDLNSDNLNVTAILLISSTILVIVISPILNFKIHQVPDRVLLIFLQILIDNTHYFRFVQFINPPRLREIAQSA